MITLILVTLPIEILFLAILHTFGWLKLPILFAIFSLGFFCCAVSALSLVSTRSDCCGRFGYPSMSHNRSHIIYGQRGWILTCMRYPFTLR
jgi:hypothetical protein